ncbi:hypothetical protein [Bradyrhizobium sp. NAS96.2]|uniref:hypothetical protein n=1 Tax=Bradyrhizobium sp. NAS96.2 TaxID=1680160 RepID=UPI001FD8F6EE|nr:hypothetical protein [Bradyrhizobium sp. NAS96.2]
MHFLVCVDCGKHRVFMITCCAAFSEAVRLKAAAIDSAQMVVDQVKLAGYVTQSPSLLEILSS